MSSKYIKYWREEILPNMVRIEIDNLDPTFIATAYTPDGTILKIEIIPANLGKVYFESYRELFSSWAGKDEMWFSLDGRIV